MKKMHIVIATGLYPPEIGGPATYTRLLEKELPKHGVSVSVLPFSRVRGFPKGVRHVIFFLICALLALRADVVYAQDPVSVGLPAFLAAFLTRRRFFLRLGGDYAWEQATQRLGFSGSLEEFVAHKNYPLLVGFFRNVQSFVAKRSEKVIVPSHYLKKMITRWGVHAGKIVVIESVFDDVSNTETKDFARATLCLSGKIVVSAGRLVPWKGFEGVIVAFQEVRKRFPNANLFIIGDGPERTYLKNFISDSPGLGVVFTGALPKIEMLRYLRAADLFVLNTGYEGFSHQILEAFSVGVPVITTDVGGNPELVKNNENGILVAYNDTGKLSSEMMRLLQDDIFSSRLADKARETIKIFSKDKMIDKFLSVVK